MSETSRNARLGNNQKKSSALFSMPGFISMHVREIFYEKDFLPVGWQSGELGSLLQHDSFVDIVWCVASFIFDDPLPLASAAKFNAEFPEFSDTCSDVHCGSCCHRNRVLPQRLTTASQACRWPLFTFLRYANENSEGMLKLRNHADINNQQIRKQAFWLMTDIFVAARVDWTIAIDSWTDLWSRSVGRVALKDNRRVQLISAVRYKSTFRSETICTRALTCGWTRGLGVVCCYL